MGSGVAFAGDKAAREWSWPVDHSHSCLGTMRRILASCNSRYLIITYVPHQFLATLACYVRQNGYFIATVPDHRESPCLTCKISSHFVVNLHFSYLSNYLSWLNWVRFSKRLNFCIHHFKNHLTLNQSIPRGVRWPERETWSLRVTLYFHSPSNSSWHGA